MHARRGAGEVRLDPEQYPDFAALRGDPSDNLPKHPGRRREDRGQVDPAVRLARRPDRPGRRGQGQGGRRAARAPVARCMLNRQLTELVRDVSWRSGRPGWRSGRGTARRCTRCSTSWSSACCATGCSRRCQRPSRRPTRASRSRRRARAGRAGRLARRARARRASRVGVASAGRAARRAPVDLEAIALSRRRRRGRVRRRDGDGPGRRGGARRVARRPEDPQGRPRPEGPAARDPRPRLDAGRAGHGHRAGRVPGAARASARSSWTTSRCATCTASCAPRPTAATGSCPCSTAARKAWTEGDRQDEMSRPARSSSWPTRSRRSSRDRRRAAARRAGAAAAGGDHRAGDRRRRRRPRAADRRWRRTTSRASRRPPKRRTR